MNPHRGVRSMVLAAWAGSAVVGAWAAQPGTTEKVGQTRSSLVPAPLPQAVPAGQGLRPVVPKPSVALPTAPTAPDAPLVVTPAAPVAAAEASLHPARSSSAAPRPGVEIAPVAPSLAAHGFAGSLSTAPPAAGTDVAPVAEAPAKRTPTKPAAEAIKPSRRGTAKSVARAPEDSEPRLRPESSPTNKAATRPALPSTQGASPSARALSGGKPAKGAHAAKVAPAPLKTVKPAALHAPKGKVGKAPQEHTPKKGQKKALKAPVAPSSQRRLNDGSHP